MGAQWKHAGRIQNSSKRGAQISKLVKEIIVAAKSGDPHPENNARLRAAIETAKKNSVPRDNIERAIKKGSGQADDGAQFETVTYEGFAPHQVPLIVECLTDNKNRTAADVRLLFRKGTLSSVAWMFERMGLVEATHANKQLDFEEVAIEAGAQNVEALEGFEIPEGHIGARFYCETTDLDQVSKYLSQHQWVITQAELSYICKNPVEITEEQKAEVSAFLEALDDHDDVHRLYTGLK